MRLKHHQKNLRFLIILVEMFFILKSYGLWISYTKLPPGLFFVLAFILFWLLNWLAGQLLIGPNPQETLTYKILPRMTFSSEWFGIIIALSIFAGFLFAKALGSLIVTLLIITICLLYSYSMLKTKKNILKHSYGLVILGFVFGMAFGNNYTSSTILIIIFVIAMIFMYLTAELDVS